MPYPSLKLRQILTFPSLADSESDKSDEDILDFLDFFLFFFCFFLSSLEPICSPSEASSELERSLIYTNETYLRMNTPIIIMLDEYFILSTKNLIYVPFFYFVFLYVLHLQGSCVSLYAPLFQDCDL